jgi:ferredoxin
VPVTIEHPAHPVSFGVKPGQDVLHGFFDYLKGRYPEGKLTKAGDPAEHQEEPLSWECKVGLCGLCAVRVLENPENLEPVDPGSPELNTLENKSFLEPDPRRHRLACLTRAKGPVRLGIPE